MSVPCTHSLLLISISLFASLQQITINSSLPLFANKIFNCFVPVLALKTMWVADPSPWVPGDGGVSISSDGCHMRNRLPGLLATATSDLSRARILWLWLVGAFLAPRHPPSLISCDHHLPSLEDCDETLLSKLDSRLIHLSCMSCFAICSIHTFYRQLGAVLGAHKKRI